MSFRLNAILGHGRSGRRPGGPSASRPRRSRPGLGAEALEGRVLLAVDFQGPTPFSTGGTDPAEVRIADLNRDGRPDLVVRNGTASVTTVINNGTGGFGAGTPLALVAGAPARGIATGDIDRNGQTDIAVAFIDTGNILKVRSFTNNGGAFTAVGADVTVNTVTIAVPPAQINNIPFPVDPDASVAAVIEDFDRDGRPDLAVAFSQIAGTNSVVRVFRGNGNGTFQNAIGINPPGAPAFLSETVFAGKNPRGLTAGDLDRDGDTDLAVVTDTGLLLLSNTGGATPFGPAAAAVAGVGANARDLALADLNADAQPDLVSASDVGITALIGNGTGNFTTAAFPAGPAGATARGVTVADFNLDGRPDVATINTDGTISVLENLGVAGPAGLLGTATRFNSGAAPTALVAADLNADGRPDIAAVNQGATNNLNVVLGTAVSQITASLAAASDSGLSNTDGITNVRQPTFTGTAQPNRRVQLLAQLDGAATATQIGEATADAQGRFSITPGTALADGSYAISVRYGDSAAVTPTSTPVTFNNGASNRLVIDTRGPKVTATSFDARAGIATFTLQDEAGGLDQAALANLASYVINGIRRNRAQALTITSVTVSPPGAANAAQTVTVRFNRLGRPNRRDRFEFRALADRLRDVAGNRLDGTFNGTFPSGNNTSGDFIQTRGGRP